MLKYFYLPGYYIHYQSFFIFDKYKEKYPELFIEDRIIAGAYDLPLGMIWNGGRASKINKYIDWAMISRIMAYHLKKENFILLHTCTNCLLEEEHLKDKDCNDFLNLYYRPLDKIIIASPLLRAYLIQQLHPSFVNSTTLGITDIDEVNKLSEIDSYVPYYGKNNDNEYLKLIKHPEHIEILCAELCHPNCPKREDHYIVESAALLDYNLSFHCDYIDERFTSIDNRLETVPHMVNNKRIEELANMGFTLFKLSGRTYTFNHWFSIICYYLIKPEFRSQAYQYMINEMNKILDKNYYKLNI